MNHPQAHADITALVYRYALLVRRGQGAACGDLFAEDAFYEICEVDARSAQNEPRLRRRIEGRAAIGAYIAASGGGAVRVCPLIHNLLIELDGNSAAASSMLESRTWPAGREFIGEYDDRLRYDGTRWLFSSRTFTLFLPGAPSTDA